MTRQKISQTSIDAFNALVSSGALSSKEGFENILKYMLGMAVESMLKGELDTHLGYKK